jgi:hypothetical protein
MDRGSGKTAKQMKDAPHGAIFIWINGDTCYAKNLALDMGRDDLEIVSPYWLESDKCRGRKLSGVVVDHAAHLNSRQCARMDMVLACVKDA